MLKNITIAWVLIWTLCGCEAYLRDTYMGNSVNIIDLETNQIINIPYKGGPSPPQTISAPSSQDYFFVMYAKDNHIDFEKRNLIGELEYVKEMPYYSRWYGMYPFALSPDENKAGYIKDNTKGVSIYDFVTETEVMLISDIFDNVNSVSAIIWIDDSTLAIILVEDINLGRKHSEIIKVDLLTKKIVNRLVIKEDLFGIGFGGYSYAPKRGLLCITSFLGIEIFIIDMKKMEIIDKIVEKQETSGIKSWISKVQWNPSETKIVYFNYMNNQFWEYDVKYKTSTPLGSISEEDPTLYALYVPNDDMYCYIYGTKAMRRSADKKLHCKSIRSIKPITIPLPGSWGGTIVIDGGKSAAYITR